MDAFLPSEIARLIYGYLCTHCSQKMADEFIEACPFMAECRQIRQSDARNFHVTFQDLSLEAILDQYSKLCFLIFQYVDENERVHKNVLHLFQNMLDKLPSTPSTTVSNVNVFKDLQNLPQVRNSPEIQPLSEAPGLENRIETSIKTANSPAIKQKRKVKKLSVPNKIISNDSNLHSTLHANISPTLSANIESSIVNSNRPTSPGNQNSIIDRANDCPVSSESEIFRKASDVHSVNLLNDVDRNCVKDSQVSYSPFRMEVTEAEEDLSSEDVTIKEITASANDASHQVKALENTLISTPANDSSSRNEPEIDEKRYGCFKSDISPSVLSRTTTISTPGKASSIFSPRNNPSPPVSVDIECCENNESLEDGTSFTEDNAKNIRRNVVVECREEGEISSSESLSDISSDAAADETASQQTLSTTPSSCANRKRINTKSTLPSLCKSYEPALPPECLGIFENLSKNFKYRSPYLTPAKSREPLHRAALSPFSRMYVTPTKPNFSRTVQINVPTGSNNAKSSSAKAPDACGGDVSITSNDVNAKKLFSTSKKSKTQSTSRTGVVKKRSMKSLSGSKKAVECRITESEHQRPFSKFSSKEIGEKKSSISRKITRQSTDIRATKNKNSLSASQHLRNSSPSKPTEFLSSVKTLRDDILLVHVKDTNEIAELDFSPEFIIYHRDSSCTNNYFALQNHSN